jgi:hypothetical protein
MTVKFIVFCQEELHPAATTEKCFLKMIYTKKNTRFSLPEEENTPK